MSNRSTLQSLLNLAEPLKPLAAKLRRLDPDEYEDPVLVTEAQIARVLVTYEAGVMTARDVEFWANLVEDREDVACASTAARDVMHELANPFLTEDLSVARSRQLRECMGVGAGIS